MNFTNSITVMVSVFFGLLLGMAALTSAAYFGGFIDWDETGQVQNVTLSQTPGMDILNNYQCRKGETKQILLGGIEDNYSPEGDETTPETDFAKSWAASAGHSSIHRDFDQAGQDLALIKYFDVPKRTAHGRFVVRMKLLSKISNDQIIIGNLPTTRKSYVDTFVAETHVLRSHPKWEVNADVYHADIGGLKLFVAKDSTRANTVLEYIQASEDLVQKVAVSIADDTLVDFMGFALCLGPESQKGTTFSITDRKDLLNNSSETLDAGTSDYTFITYAKIDGVSCNPYTGCVSCETELPLACFRFTNSSTPTNHPQLSPFWSGGDIQFSDIIKGASFKTADSAHEFCKRQFGLRWRVLSHHDGFWMGSIAARQINTPAKNMFWIDGKDQPHGNCWAQRSEIGESGG